MERRMLPLILRHTSMTWPWRRLPERPLPDVRQLLLELPLRLLQQPGSDAPLQALLLALAARLGASQACLLQAGGAGWQRLGPHLEPEDCPLHDGAASLPGPDEAGVCQTCLAQGRHRLVCSMPVDDGPPALLLLVFERSAGQATRRELLAIGRQLGDVLRAFAADRQARRRELAAERGVLARELHDSVAQQLGYLQIRASRLQAVLADPAQRTAADAMLGDLRETLQGLQRQVRELITTARLTMDGRTLRQALEASVDEFSRRSGCVFSLDNRLPLEPLPGEVELQMLQIVREALANVVRHSHARRVQLQLRRVAGLGVEIRVSDDGVGLPADLPEQGHFGLRIMRERAAAIGAELSIGALEPHGTCVRLRWRCA